MSDTKIQWHPGFVAAMNLEFRENRDDLKHQKETRKSIMNAVKSFRDLGISEKQMRELLVRNYELTPDEAAAYMSGGKL